MSVQDVEPYGSMVIMYGEEQVIKEMRRHFTTWFAAM